MVLKSGYLTWTKTWTKLKNKHKMLIITILIIV